MTRYESMVRGLLEAEGIDLCEKDSAIDCLKETSAPSVCIDVYISLILPDALMRAGMTITEQQLDLFGVRP